MNIIENIKRDILKNTHISLSKKTVSKDDFKSTFRYVSDDNKVIGDFVELSNNLFDGNSLINIFDHLIKLEKVTAEKKFLVFNNYSDSLNDLAKHFGKLTHIDFYYMEKDKTYRLPSDEKKIIKAKFEERNKRLLSIGTWDEKSIKKIDEARKFLGKWKIEEF